MSYGGTTVYCFKYPCKECIIKVKKQRFPAAEPTYAQILNNNFNDALAKCTTAHLAAFQPYVTTQPQLEHIFYHPVLHTQLLFVLWILNPSHLYDNKKKLTRVESENKNKVKCTPSPFLTQSPARTACCGKLDRFRSLQENGGPTERGGKFFVWNPSPAPMALSESRQAGKFLESLQKFCFSQRCIRCATHDYVIHWSRDFPYKQVFQLSWIFPITSRSVPSVPLWLWQMWNWAEPSSNLVCHVMVLNFRRLPVVHHPSFPPWRFVWFASSFSFSPGWLHKWRMETFTFNFFIRLGW